MNNNEAFTDLYKRDRKLFGDVNLHHAEVLPYIEKGSLLDLGGGHGRFSLYFAQKGLDVTNVDINENAIKIFNEELLKMGLKAKGIIQDIRNFPFINNYDNIICVAMLNLLEKHDAIEMLNKIKHHTNKGGINFIGGFFENHNNLFQDKAKNGRNNLLNMYTDWKILYYKKFMGNTISNEPKECVFLVSQKM